MLLAAASAAQAQDALTVGPEIFKKVTENNRVRVLEARFRPGAKMAMHKHPDHLFYMLTDGTLIIKPEGRKAYEMTLTAGEALFLPAQTRASENETDRTIRALIVEFKQVATPAASAKAKKRGRSSPAKPRRGRAA
jgi:quercetin dioxygenase-like cupin family protein